MHGPVIRELGTSAHAVTETDQASKERSGTATGQTDARAASGSTRTSCSFSSVNGPSDMACFTSSCVFAQTHNNGNVTNQFGQNGRTVLSREGNQRSSNRMRAEGSEAATGKGHTSSFSLSPKALDSELPLSLPPCTPSNAQRATYENEGRKANRVARVQELASQLEAQRGRLQHTKTTN